MTEPCPELNDIFEKLRTLEFLKHLGAYKVVSVRTPIPTYFDIPALHDTFISNSIWAYPYKAVSYWYGVNRHKHLWEVLEKYYPEANTGCGNGLKYGVQAQINMGHLRNGLYIHTGRLKWERVSEEQCLEFIGFLERREYEKSQRRILEQD